MTHKVCNTCGKVQDKIPSTSRPWLDEQNKVYAQSWECSCGSTMFVITDDEMKKILALKTKKEA